MFFGFFKKKKWAHKKQSNGAIDLILNLLAMQFTMGGYSNPTDADLDNWALGYIFGLHVGILQSTGFTDQTQCMVIMTACYDELFGGVENGVRVFRKSLDLQRDKIFQKGRLAGGMDALAFCKSKTPCIGLWDHLRGESTHFDEIEKEAVAATKSQDDLIYIDERLVNLEYVLTSANGSASINAALFTFILLTFRNTGWRGAQCLFDSSTNTMKWLSGSYSIDAKDAGDIALFLNQLAIRDSSFVVASQPLLRTASSGAFTVVA